MFPFSSEAVFYQVTDYQMAVCYLKNTSFSQELVIFNPEWLLPIVGLPFLQALYQALEREFPEIQMSCVCDCGKNPAFALEAIQLGFKYICFGGEAAYFTKLQQIAASHQITILKEIIPRSG